MHTDRLGIAGTQRNTIDRPTGQQHHKHGLKTMQKQNNSRLQSILPTAGVFLAFFAFGFIENIKGPALPALLSEMRFSYVTGANIILMSYFRFLAATVIGGFLADLIGRRSVINSAAVAFIGGIIILGYGGSAQDCKICKASKGVQNDRSTGCHSTGHVEQQNRHSV